MMKPGGDCFIQTGIYTYVFKIFEEMVLTDKWENCRLYLDIYYSPEFKFVNPAASALRYLDVFFPGSYQIHSVKRFHTFQDVETFKGQFKVE